MTERLQVYKCNVCGNIVEVLHTGVGELVCCRQPMELHQEKADDVGQEKHVPVAEKVEDGIKVKVGSVPHAVEEEHYIEWIELIADGKVYRHFLKPGSAAEAVFAVHTDSTTAREYRRLATGIATFPARQEKKDTSR